MNIIVFLLIGLFAGWIANFLVEGHGLGTLGDLIVGVIGSFVGGYAFNIMGITAYGFWGSFGMSIIGAVVFLFFVGLFTGKHGFRKSLGKT